MTLLVSLQALVCWELEKKKDGILNFPWKQQLLSSADNFCNMFGPSTGLTECRSWIGFRPFDTLIVFLIFFFEKVNFEENQQMTNKSMKKIPRMHIRIQYLSYGQTIMTPKKPVQMHILEWEFVTQNCLKPQNPCSNHEIHVLFEHGFYLKKPKCCGSDWPFRGCFCSQNVACLYMTLCLRNDVQKLTLTPFCFEKSSARKRIFNV